MRPVARLAAFRCGRSATLARETTASLPPTTWSGSGVARGRALDVGTGKGTFALALVELGFRSSPST